MNTFGCVEHVDANAAFGALMLLLSEAPRSQWVSTVDGSTSLIWMTFLTHNPLRDLCLLLVLKQGLLLIRFYYHYTADDCGSSGV